MKVLGIDFNQYLGLGTPVNNIVVNKEYNDYFPINNDFVDFDVNGYDIISYDFTKNIEDPIRF